MATAICWPVAVPHAAHVSCGRDRTCDGGNAMVVRRAFTLRLKPGALSEYVRQHDEIWPELVVELKAQGVSQLTIFERDGGLWVYCEGTDYEAMDRVWASDVHDRWASVMAPLIDVNDDNKVDALPLTEVWHLETGAADS
jgi:L-rhamnose mutarotase